jgi:hypothetical protein
MCGENRVVVRTLPTPALKGISQSQCEALNLPNRVSMRELPGPGRCPFQNELPPQVEKRVGVVGVKVGVVVGALRGVIVRQQIGVGGMLDEVDFARPEEGAERLGQIVHRGRIDQLVPSIAPSQSWHGPLDKQQEQHQRHLQQAKAEILRPQRARVQNDTLGFSYAFSHVIRVPSPLHPLRNLALPFHVCVPFWLRLSFFAHLRLVLVAFWASF